MAKQKLIPAPLDEKNVVTDFIECDIFQDECAHQIECYLNTYLGFYKGHPMMLWYTHGKNYLKAYFMNRLLDNKSVRLQLEEYMKQGNDDDNNNLYVTSGRGGDDMVEFHFWFKDND